jgi:prepilin signal peptidase PulO-like enzyme (type II secretory pathway)
VQLRWYDLFPVISFIILLAKCRACRKPISWQYPIVELATAALFLVAGAFWLPFPAEFTAAQGLILLRDLLAVSALLFLFVFDYRYYLLPDIVTLPAAASFFLLNLLIGYSWQHLLVGMLAGGGFFLAQFVVSKGKWVGGGDIRFGLLMGALLGWPLVLVALFGAYLIGAMFAVLFLALGKLKFGAKIPFGTFLALATITTLWAGQHMLDWYLQFVIF